MNEKQKNKSKNQKGLANNEPKKKTVKNNEEKKLNNISFSVPLIIKRNVNEEISYFKKNIKELVDKVNKFINFEEMKKSIK